VDDVNVAPKKFPPDTVQLTVVEAYQAEPAIRQRSARPSPLKSPQRLLSSYPGSITPEVIVPLRRSVGQRALQAAHPASDQSGPGEHRGGPHARDR
jgi:hypothetical protein